MITGSNRDPSVAYHLSCFLRDSNCPSDLSTLTGFKKLKKIDREAVLLAQEETAKKNRKRPQPTDAKTSSSKKPKVESKTADIQEPLRLQSERLWKLRDQLEQKVSKDALIGLLEYNDQHVPSGLSNLLDAVSDAMMFGALALCPSCKNGPLRYSGNQYKCSAMATEWAACLHTTREPNRLPFRIPEEYFDVDILRNYKYVPRTRLFATDIVPVNSTAGHPSNKKGKKSALNSDGLSLDEDVVRCTLKGGAVVDPESGLADRASVMKGNRGEPLSAVLGMVDLVKGSNSFYKLQALKSDTGVSYWVFRAWGRIGTQIGGTKLEKFTTASSARQSFEDLYLEKTGNEWRDRENFQKKPYKFYEMDLDYGKSEAHKQSLEDANRVPSSLHPALQSLIRFICDIDSMKQTMLQFDLDLRRMPLGKLSKRQIHEAYGILNNLTKLLDRSSKKKAPPDQTTLLSESTRFYTLIPHDFGMKTPPLLDTLKVIKEKLHMLEDLLEIEVAYSMLKQDVSMNENPLDQHYKHLKTDLKPLDPDSEEYARIVEYVRRTHGSTHTHFSLEVDAVFDVERADERKRFNSFKRAQHNKQLLWHGSRRTNWMGILSQGLRIAPPEAPVTGYMFGKGIYFADSASKSANYCFMSQSQPEGLLLLCEVILGDWEECLAADASPLDPKFHSRKGIGSYTPDPSTHHTNSDGVIYPIGDLVPSGRPNVALLYNEYVVYDAAQVKQKYLVKVKFVT
ncbi:unnamed protein product [Dicrocoelium dendriticum]|nr:unnamed protein product [Dicrocoelium dendriticum]